MKVYVILSAQNSAAFGLGFAYVSMVCSSLKKAMRAMDVIAEEVSKGTFYWNDPERPTKHYVLHDIKPDYTDQLIREIAITHELHGVKTGTTYYRLESRRINDGLPI